ncbi:hypothetical protein QBC38DRAFT_520194 [Podospora fimiseda]|uniref:Oxidase ustYa n=1 Tax=Podospora fimiseda TaxID=252190 RepID=A0AAN6YSK1_9PEZI|nr:hypothetical protein QBC38DRAFT_520194 [Podospora fimiseda]
MMQPIKSPLPLYKDIQHESDNHQHTQDETHTDASSALMSGEDKAWSDITAGDHHHHHHHPSQRRKRACSIIMSARSILDTILLLIILGLLVERRWWYKTEKSARFDVTGDITGFAPQISQQITTFKPDPMFVPENGSDFFSEQVKQKWLGIVPRGLGYVQINDTSQFNNLPTPLKFYPNSTFTTSMTHQLHCLHAIVRVVAAYTSDRLDMLPEEGAWHVAHCFDYMRQSIMCAGDLALEGQQTTFPPNVKGSDGWDAKHVCKDYGQILKHLEGNRADDELWI